MERFNRTLKSRMWRYVTRNNTYRYIADLQELVFGYNASLHKGVGMAPLEVNERNQLKIWKKYYSQGVNRKPFKFAISEKGLFAKGYVQSWSEERFVIELRLRRTPNVYVLRYLSGETLYGVFYKEQLKRVKAHDIFPISRIVRNSCKQHSCSGEVDRKCNSWIPLSDLQNI